MNGKTSFSIFIIFDRPQETKNRWNLFSRRNQSCVPVIPLDRLQLTRNKQTGTYHRPLARGAKRSIYGFSIVVSTLYYQDDTRRGATPFIWLFRVFGFSFTVICPRTRRYYVVPRVATRVLQDSHTWETWERTSEQDRPPTPIHIRNFCFTT